MLRFNVSLVVQGDSERKFNILVGNRIGHCGKRSWYEPVSHLYGCLGRVVGTSTLFFLDFFLFCQGG
jgi:hypothetical protein